MYLSFPQAQHIGVYRRVKPCVLKSDVILEFHLPHVGQDLLQHKVQQIGISISLSNG